MTQLYITFNRVYVTRNKEKWRYLSQTSGSENYRLFKNMITNSYDEKEASEIQNRYLTSYLNCRVEKTVPVIHVCQHISQIRNADDKPNTLR